MTRQWKIGEKIQDRWQIYKIFSGGMGIVYIVYDHHPDYRQIFAAKTFQDEVFSRNPQITKRFTQEAHAWINLDIHENITNATFVKGIEGKPYIFMEYVGGGNLRKWIGRIGLTGDLPQMLRFAVNFCDGMIHANSKGLKAHRDIKPENCLVTYDRVLKITDFGLAKIIGEPGLSKSKAEGIDKNEKVQEGFFKKLFGKHQDKGPDKPDPKIEDSNIGLTRKGIALGTPMYMAPEQFDDFKQVDIRADIYSFGVMLFEMVTGHLPFTIHAYTEKEFFEKCRVAHQNQTPAKLRGGNSELEVIIKTCLSKDPFERFKDFITVRERLVELNNNLTGEPAPKPREGKKLNAIILNNKGLSLSELGRHQEALDCLNRALDINPQLLQAWANKGVTLGALGRYEEEITCMDNALKINSSHVELWLNKGAALVGLNKHEEGIECYDHALAIDPHYVKVWSNKGAVLEELGRAQEALDCYDQALKLNPRSDVVLYNKGNALKNLGRHQEALTCFDQALDINPYMQQAWFRKSNILNALGQHQEVINCCNRNIELNPYLEEVWSNKGNALYELGRYSEALVSLNHSIELDPNFEPALYNKGNVLYALGQLDEALDCFDEATKLNADFEKAWSNKGMVLNELNRNKEAIECYNRALELNPNDPIVWSNKGNALSQSGRIKDAIACYDKAIELNPDFGDVWFNKGTALGKISDQWDEVINCFNQSIRINPKDYQAWYNKGVTLINAFQDYAESLISFQKAHQLGHPQAAQLITFCRQKLNRI